MVMCGHRSDTAYVSCGFIPVPIKGKACVSLGMVMEIHTCSILMSNPICSIVE